MNLKQLPTFDTLEILSQYKKSKILANVNENKRTKPLKIVQTELTPKVVFDAENEIFEIIGRSMPYNSVSFYEPLHNWINQYKLFPNPKTEFVFKLDYFDTSSSKQILEIMKTLMKINHNGNEIVIQWYYEKNDEYLQEAGEEYAEIVGSILNPIKY